MDKAFKALADPSRRTLLDRLRAEVVHPATRTAAAGGM